MGKYRITVLQGTTFRRAFWWRGPLVDVLSGDPILDDNDVALPGPYYDLAGYTGRMQIRDKVTSPDPPLLELTTANGGIIIDAPTVTLLPWVKAATVEAIELAGAQTIDGIALKVGERVLVKNQAVTSDNGIYIVGSGTWARAEDADSSGELSTPAAVFVYGGRASDRSRFGGTLNGDTVWKQQNALGSIGSAQAWSRITTLGKFEIVMTPTQTSSLVRSGVYDVELISGPGEVHRPLEGAIRLSAEVTR